MSDERSDGGPAFPGDHEVNRIVDFDEKLQMSRMVQQTEKHPGMSLRDWFAGQALAGMMAAPSGSLCDDDGDVFRSPISDPTLARLAYRAADAMLAERKAV